MGCRDGPKRRDGSGLAIERHARMRGVAPRTKRGGHPTLHSASPARASDYVRVDPDEPATDGCLVVVRDPARGRETVIRLLIERDGRRVLRALDERCPERTVDAGSEADIRGVVVLVGNTV